jgi:hypothetical protein
MVSSPQTIIEKKLYYKVREVFFLLCCHEIDAHRMEGKLHKLYWVTLDIFGEDLLSSFFKFNWRMGGGVER